MVVLQLSKINVLAVEGGFTPYDSGVRHIATLAGYLSYGLMAMTVCFGILTTTGWARRGIRRQTMLGGHMLLAVLSLTVGLLHGVVYAFQTTVHFTFTMVFIPFVQNGEFEVGLGIIGLELGLAVAISIWLQRALGYRRWHLIHYLAYPAFALSLAHTIAVSPEVRSLGGIGLIVFAAAAAVLLLGVLRTLPATTLVTSRITAKEA